MIGLLLVILAGLSKTVLYDMVIGGIYNARFIDNTYQTESCSTMFLGDITCPGMRFQGWSMSSKDKFETCMSGGAPSSKSLSGAAKWCEDGSRGCKKPGSCRPGSKHAFYMFSVLNADEVLQGYPAEVKEMEPISVLKRSDKFGIDKELWNSEGIAKWSENSTWELLDESQAPLLEQVIVVPNPVAFVSLPSSSGMSSENVVYLAAAASFYAKLQEMIDTNVAAFAGILPKLFGGSSAINVGTLVQDIYRDGSPLVKLGAVFANADNCRMLINLATTFLNLKGSAEFFVMMMCTDAYTDNVGLSAYAKVLELAKIRVTPEDGMFFYEYEKNCRELNEKPSYLCKKNVICPDPATRDACLAPSLSELDVTRLFSLFSKLYKDMTANVDELVKFVESCEIQGHVIQPISLCKMVIEQLQKAGHAAIFSANPQGDAVMAAYGWTDRSVAAQMIPYFINGTVGQIMDFGSIQGLPKDPITQQQLGIRGWSNKTEATFSRHQVSSKFGYKGLNYYKSAMGMDHSCAFSYRCMTQASFLLDGKTCVSDDTCRPSSAEGYEVGTIPGYFFGDEKFGTRDFHGIGKSKTLFVSDLFVQANFTQVHTDLDWGNIRVDVWNVSGVGMRTENCDALDPMDRGIDCASPAGTINIGYNAIYSTGSTPNNKVLPLYSSYPHFQHVTPDNKRLEKVSYDPLTRLKIFACDSCPKQRDFATYLYTDPETGTHVKGSQKIQLNMRFSANPSSLTGFPNKVSPPAINGSPIIKANTDLVLPLYWIDKFDSAADYQKDQIAFVQSLPRTFNIVFWVALWVGILALALGGLLLWRGLVLRKAAKKQPGAEEIMDQKALEAGETGSVATVNT